MGNTLLPENLDHGVSCKPFHAGKGTRQTKKIPRLPLRGTSFQGKEGECRSPAFVAHTRFFIGL